MNSFPALLDRKDGTVTISPQHVEFVSHDLQTRLIIPLIDLRITRHTRNSVHYYLSHRENPKPEIQLQSRASIQLLSSLNVENATAILKINERRLKMKSLLWLSPFLFGILCLFLIPFAFSFVSLNWLNHIVSIEQEQNLGGLVWDYVQPEFKLLENSKPKESLKKLLDILVASNPELQKFNFEIHVQVDPQMNAFTLPGGKIVFNTGLLNKATDVSEIFGVLAHEVAHVEQRHILKALSSRVGSLVGFVIVYSVLGGDAAAVVMQVQNFTSLSYSRWDESQADQRGLRFIQQSGFSGKGLVSFFSKLAAESSGLEKPLNFLSTHPSSEDRAHALEKKISNEPTITKEFPVELEAFKI